MIKTVTYEGRFKKDMRLMQKRGKDLAKLMSVMEALQEGIALLPRHRNHRLSGDLAGYWECHIEPDWLLLYKTSDFARTGTHSDLF